MELLEYRKLFIELPCKDAQGWLKSQSSLEEAWKNCHRGDWLWWALIHGKGTLPDKSISVEYANWCVSKIKSNYYHAAAAAAADDAADAYDRKEQADWIREHVSYPF